MAPTPSPTASSTPWTSARTVLLPSTSSRPATTSGEPPTSASCSSPSSSSWVETWTWTVPHLPLAAHTVEGTSTHSLARFGYTMLNFLCYSISSSMIKIMQEINKLHEWRNTEESSSRLNFSKSQLSEAQEKAKIKTSQGLVFQILEVTLPKQKLKIFKRCQTMASNFRFRTITFQKGLIFYGSFLPKPAFTGSQL